MKVDLTHSKFEYTVAGQRWILTSFAFHKVKKDYLKILENYTFYQVTSEEFLLPLLCIQDEKSKALRQLDAAC